MASLYDHTMSGNHHSSTSGRVHTLLVRVFDMRHHVQFPLLDAPLTWLSQLATKHLDKKSKQHLFSTCKGLRDLGFGQADRVLSQVPRSKLEAVKAASSLQLLARCKEGAYVKLVLQDEEGSPEPPSFTIWLRTLCSYASIAPGFPLRHVTCVELQGDVLGDIVPLELAMACPNMTHLIRWGQFISWRDIAFAPVACTQLRQLTIHNLTRRQSSHNSMKLSVQQLTRQLQSLPMLQNLEYMGVDDDDEKDNQGNVGRAFVSFLMDSVQVLSQQLTSLHLCCEDLPRLFVSIWPNLVSLRLPDLVVEEGEMQVVFEHANSLRELEIDSITTGTSDVQLEICKLQSLSLRVVYLSDLSHYLFRGLQRLCLKLLYIEEGYKQYVQSATQRLLSVGTVVSGRPDGMIGIHIEKQRKQDSVPLPTLVSLLLPLPHKAILLSSDKALGEPWLQLFAQLNCHTLALAPQVLTPACLATLLQQLPKLHTLQFVHAAKSLPDAAALGIQVCTLCMTTPRPITMQVSHKLAKHLGTNWQAMLGTSLQASDRQYVRIERVKEPAE